MKDGSPDCPRLGGANPNDVLNSLGENISFNDGLFTGLFGATTCVVVFEASVWSMMFLYQDVVACFGEPST